MPGSIRQRGPKVWQVRVSLGKDPDSGRYRYAQRYVNGGKHDAQRAAAELSAETQRGRHTVEELLERWMAHIESQGRAPSTLVRYRSAIDVNIKPRLGRVEISKVDGATLDAFYGQLQRGGLSALTVRKSHAILSAAFSQAIRWGWIDLNPVVRASPPSPKGREIRPPTVAELRRLVDACAEDHPDLGCLIYAAATTGARRGELCGLRWSDVDLDAATATFARSISDAGGEVAVKDPKAHQARRIALDASTVDVLREHRRRAEERSQLVGVLLATDAFVWSQALDGATAYRPDRVTGAFRSLRDRCGLDHVTFHTLRHFAATTLAGQGVGVRTIAGRLGHANPGITLRTYAHFLDTADRNAADAIGDALAGVHPASASRPSAASSARRGTTSRRPRRTEGSSPRATRS